MTAIVFGGVFGARVFGVPVFKYIGIQFGWRPAFWLVAGRRGNALGGICVFVPRTTSKSAFGVVALIC
ncbi:MFS transporter, partial [Enterobacter bugandensis]|nr:MFS transporter [Enterobacter bugandensis]